MSKKEYLKKESSYSVIYMWTEISSGWNNINSGQEEKAETAQRNRKQECRQIDHELQDHKLSAKRALSQ